jgi:ABC-type oligopeptide transport system substrate-binding subunit
MTGDDEIGKDAHGISANAAATATIPPCVAETADAAFTAEMRRHFQISIDWDWLPDYPRPSSYLPQFFSRNGGTSNGYVCDPRLDQEMQHADVLRQSNPRRAAELWTHIDHEIVNNAHWVTTVNGHEPELVSKRLRNYQYSPVGDFIADQVWLR